MESTWEGRHLLACLSALRDVPQRTMKALQKGTTAQYLDTVSRLALDPLYTCLIFTVHEAIFPELCSRWISNPQSSHDLTRILSAFARVLPLAPYLSSHARTLIHLYPAEISQLFGLRRTAGISDEFHQPLHHDLLAIFRLLIFNNAEFGSIVSPTQMQLMMNHPHLPTRYLAIRILCLYLHTSDEATSKMVADYIGNDTAIQGSWEDKLIDYFFLSLWENTRLDQLRKEIDEIDAARNRSPGARLATDIIQSSDISPSLARFSNILIPRLEGTAPVLSSLVITKTVEHNMYMLAKAVRDSNNILVTGPPGAGKSSIIRDLTRELCRSSSTITIHLNEQSDIKLLLGVYSSENSPGSFSWLPGILTQAVLKGNWVIVEDIDRAPAEIVSTLLPLLERGELFVQNQSESILAAPGFKLIATVRSITNAKGGLVIPGSASIGHRHWTTVSISPPDHSEVAEILTHRHAVLRPYIHSIMGVYKSLTSLGLTQGAEKRSLYSAGPSYGPRQLLRWCRRLDRMLKTAGFLTGYEPISESTNDNIFLEAIDCFADHLPFGATKASCVRMIAQELRIPPERVDYCLEVRKPVYCYTSTSLQIGRASLKPTNPSLSSKRPTADRPFAMTNETLRILESVGMALETREPCLLVGETGTGKTALVQHLAGLMRTKLNIFNLSQQSETGDLLGGYKPVSLRTLAISMMKTFEELFSTTFSIKRNERYIHGVTKAVEKGRWDRVLASWQEALQMVRSAFSSESITAKITDQEPHSKRRKIKSPKYDALRIRWDDFESEVRLFQMHLASGSKGFAFSFVEGNIVKAARNGEWVLLDEINLASPDTLESLADLLSDEMEGGPSLLLSESGRAERIYADKNFRIFGAMNPATDIGKRDLPPSLRSRFTEIFVDPPDRKFETLVMVAKKYLGGHANIDIRAPSDIANLYMEVQKLAEANTIIDGSGQKPHFSLRTLTRTLVYVNDITPVYGLRRSLFEGFSMSFLTLLSAESGLQVLSLIEKNIIGSQRNGRASMKQIPRPPEGKKPYIQFKHYWIAQGGLPTQEQPHYILTPFVERNLLNLVRATSSRRFPILLQGPTSSGKTSMIEYLAKMSGNKFLRVNNHEHTDIQEYLGTYTSNADGNLHYQEGILVRALREGSWIVLDELNLAPSDVLEALNRLLDDNKELRIPETQEIVRPHENFMLFATQNPPGVYGGRKVLSRAFRNRFLELHFDEIPEEELETILRERCHIAPSSCTRIVAVYRKLSIIRQKGRLFEQKNSFATLRDLFRWALRDADDREQLAINGFLLLAERVRDLDERSMVKQVIEEVMKVKIDEGKLYAVDKAPQTTALVMNMQSKTVWTRSMLRLHVLVAEALKHSEPVLLVGDTGSGKTTICQVAAEHMRRELYTVNAHQNMDTSDLIGSQRPVRNKAHLESQLAQDLARVLRLPSRDDGSFNDLSTMLTAYDALSDDKTSAILPEMRRSIETNRLRCTALFEWVDGSIVHAMKTGQHFLLDEISLADDSVLERLNSVLEPSRTLFLAEKATDSTPVAASEGFQIYATMNPGGDYGKKELSPALRNRFTEIWVPPVRGEQELLEIARAKLEKPYTSIAQQMIAFAAWYSARYSPVTPSVSIRDLLRWLSFVNKFGSLDKYSAILEGAAMVYIDRLGADPAAKTWISNESISQERRTCLSRLSELFQWDMDNLYWQQLPISMNEESLAVGPFNVRGHGRGPQDPTYSLRAPTTMRNITKIVRALQVTKSILLEGSPGVGKTTLITAIAKAIGMPLTRINLSDQTDLTDLFGSDVPLEGADAGQFGWHQAPFLKAMQHGEWVLLDEMNLASQSVLEGLNACLDHRGQVFVPELDQIFSRHDDFVIFAAQNPRHQGGGRKGLPASFVNRFTVVYIEDFQRDDLLMICTQAFPSCSQQLVAKITESISAVSSYMLGQLKGSLQGGPWEFNLRDAFRWLQLLADNENVLPVRSATDFVALLFTQRLRTPEDRAIISALVEGYFPSKKKSNSIFLGLGKDYLQVGLGVLSRKNHMRGAESGDSFVKGLDLSIIESIIFCVQENWPCLLVGPSGSGKSHAINELARIVGAELVTVPLNAETDTIDLIGGFEQVDPQRRVSQTIKKLKRFTKQLIADEISNRETLSSYFDVLEGHLQQRTPDLLEVKAALQQCAQSLPNVDFASLIVELEGTMQHTRDNVKGRFEWVDGILVNALRDGAWLVLDNANLCSPSILDRINSLLEPNGFLNINEHRAADGTTPTLKPHADFRLFLTVDPRHGELSRAMRNRSVELFLLATREEQKSHFMLEASLARYANFKHFDWEAVHGLRLLELAKVCCDHLDFSDISQSPRWCEQLEQGLIVIPPSLRSSISSVVRTYNRALNQNTGFIQYIRETLQRTLTGWDTEAHQSQLSAQTSHPLNNPLFVRLSVKGSVASDLSLLGSKFELLWRTCCFRDRIQQLKGNANARLTSSMSRLELSFAPKWMTQNETVLPIGNFLEKIDQLLHKVLALDDREYLNGRLVEAMEKVLEFAEDLSEAAESSLFDDASLRTYQIIGQSTADQISDSLVHPDLAASFVDALAVFNESWRLTSGLGMEVVWELLRPPSIDSTSLVELRLGTEQLADRFDALSWACGASLQELIALRGSIVQVSSMLDYADADSLQKLKDAQTALEDLERSQDPVIHSNNKPFFQHSFEGLLQYSQCQKFPLATRMIQCDPIISLFACRPTKHLVETPDTNKVFRALYTMNEGSGIASSNDVLMAARATLGASMLQEFASMSQAPLRSLEMLRDEVTALANRTATLTSSLSCNHLDTFGIILMHIHSEIIRVHEDVLETTSLAHYRTFVEKFTGVEFDHSLEPTPILQVQFGHRGFEHFQRVLEGYFNPSIAMLHRASRFRAIEQDCDEIAATAASWILFFTGCLVLYVPDRTFDPASKVLVQRDRHQKRKTELEAKIWALQEFEEAFTGQPTSLRSQMTQSKLDVLGEERPVRQVLRPRPSALGELQAIFNGVLQSIIRKSPTQEALHTIADGEELQKSNIGLLRANITRFIARLHNDFRLYVDITRPLINLLQGLDVGLALALIGHEKSLLPDEDFLSMYRSTPFLGMEPDSFDSITVDGMRSVASHTDVRMMYLRVSAVVLHLEYRATGPSSQTTLEVFHSFYEEWKQQLNDEQREEASKSSLYRYRGSEEDEGKDLERELLEIFPSEEPNPADMVGGRTSSSTDPRSLSQALAACHRNIFGKEQTASQPVIDILRHAAKFIGQLPKVFLTCPVPVDRLLPALINQLDDNCEGMQDKSTTKTSYNFYKDANLPEVQKLAKLIHLIQKRYLELSESWPEHATIHDVLKVANQLFDMPHTDPISKFMTKSEQLHHFMHEWQTVASREFSAAKLYDHLTDCLVRWRRLELSTWARLLDNEDAKCSEDVDAWWFIAYETIVAVPLSMINSGEAVTQHAERLLTTLTDFMLTTSIGHYTWRLQLLQCFKSHVQLLARKLPTMKTVANALSNFLEFYQRFSKKTKESIREGRQALEKDMKEIFILASWKDTNITTLRESAKRSHSKLFKVIRRYRRLLAQPVRPILLQELSNPDGSPILPATASYVAPANARDLALAIEICERCLPDWALKPARFTNPVATATRMASTAQLPSVALSIAEHIDDYASDVLENVKLLQRETPATRTKDNGDLLKHLKARKRKLFLDTLKDIRQMGFHSNISGTVLVGQSSIPQILASSPAFQHHELNSNIEIAESYWHATLDNINLVREKFRSPSKDLSHVEASRSLNYLESMLSMVLEQRNALSRSFDEVHHLDGILETWQSLSNLHSVPFNMNNAQANLMARKIFARITWLPLLLGTACVLLEKHSRLGDTNSGSTIQKLKEWKVKTQDIVIALGSLTKLPGCLSSSLHQETHQRASITLKDLNTDLQKLTVEFPGVGFILRQLTLWTDIGIVESAEDIDGIECVPSIKFDDKVTKTHDSILVATQRMQAALTGIPSTYEEVTWLTRAFKTLANVLKGLHIGEVIRMLETLMHQIPYSDLFKGQEPETVSALCALLFPIIQQYRQIAKHTLDCYVADYRALCRLTSVLARSFSRVLSQGFCEPESSAGTEAGKTDKLEGGVGLGEGEGAEDISKDVQADEDLSELAQEKGEKEEETTEGVDEAVDMNNDDLEGALEDVSGGETEGEAESDAEGQDIDEETGNVDNLDPGAVDEKLWEGEAERPQKEKEGEQGKGKSQKDGQRAQKGEESNKPIEDEEEELEDEGETGEGEEVIRGEAQPLDPHVQEQQNLDLPEEMDLDQDGRSSISSLRESDLGEASDSEQEEIEGDQNPVTEGTEPDDGTEPEETPAFSPEAKASHEDDTRINENGPEDNEAGSPVDTEPDAELSEEDRQVLPEHTDDTIVDPVGVSTNDTQGQTQGVEGQDDDEQTGQNGAYNEEQGQARAKDQDNSQTVTEEGTSAQTNKEQRGSSNDEAMPDEATGNQAFKKLGDVLEKWHRQQKQIRDAAEARNEAPQKQSDSAIVEKEFEHLHDDDADADAQALGAAAEEEAHTLDQRALDTEIQDQPADRMPNQDDQDMVEDQDEIMEDLEEFLPLSPSDKAQLPKPSAFIGKSDRREQQTGSPTGLDELNDDIFNSQIDPTEPPPTSLTVSSRSLLEARQIWTHYESHTHPLSLILTEQLRLILAPTQATKMRGDFRTGKRLNIKRIIPYIASNYKRDKIWMRRSMPQKRNYQVMLAVDDSRSMGESGSGQLAFEALVLVAKSLSMLEVGEIAVVGFGEDVKVAHEFDKPWSPEAGVSVIQQFGFKQTRTNVRKLVAEATELFRDARAKQASSSSATENWQLLLVISDGLCEDHETIRRLVRQAQEERIMIVFVIVDALKGESIVNMSQAVFEPDPHGEGGQKLKIKRYLDDFPFTYYLVVGDVKELPGVLATALRGWFSEIAGEAG